MLKIQYSYEIDGKRQKSASKNAFGQQDGYV